MKCIGTRGKEKEPEKCPVDYDDRCYYWLKKDPMGMMFKWDPECVQKLREKEEARVKMEVEAKLKSEEATHDKV